MADMPTLKLVWNSDYTRLRAWAFWLLATAALLAAVLLLGHALAESFDREAQSRERSVQLLAARESSEAARSYWKEGDRYSLLLSRRDFLRRQQPKLMLVVIPLLLVVFVLEWVKWRQPKFLLVLDAGEEQTRLSETRNPRTAMAELNRLAAEHGLPDERVINEALTRLKR